MLVGHSSGIEDLALLLARRGEALGQLRAKFPTGALASLEFSGGWSGLDARGARLVAFVTPRELDAPARPRKS
jgi:phosphohistidine phosphatase